MSMQASHWRGLSQPRQSVSYRGDQQQRWDGVVVDDPGPAGEHVLDKAIERFQAWGRSLNVFWVKAAYTTNDRAVKPRGLASDRRPPSCASVEKSQING